MSSKSVFSDDAVRGLFAGSGSAALNDASVCAEVLKLVKPSKPCSETVLLYLGTATYDSEHAKDVQTAWFANKGVQITSLVCATQEPIDAKAKIAAADIILVSGGNTLYAIDKWKSLGLTPLLRAAKDRGCVLTGGSAGAICWFSGGHSDSMDPVSYVEPQEAIDTWSYIRVPCLDFLPGLVCPHYDKVQSNGILRAHDFQEMILRHKVEQGLCIDHWAALIVQDGKYTVFQAVDKPGSVLEDGKFSENQEGKPGIWTKQVQEDGSVLTQLVPNQGSLSDLLQFPSGELIPEPKLEQARSENPQVTK